MVTSQARSRRPPECRRMVSQGARPRFRTAVPVAGQLVSKVIPVAAWARSGCARRGDDRDLTPDRRVSRLSPGLVTPEPGRGRLFMAELEPRNFLQPCLLLLLMEQPDHGYELAARLRPMHDGEGDPGSIYRALRGLERQGLVRSEWNRS